MRPTCQSLIEDQSVSLMHRLGDPMPRLYLLAAMDAGRPGVTLALHRNLRCLANDQRRGCALRVVAGGKGTRHIARLACPRARQWRHDDAMPQSEGTNPVRLEQHVRVRRLSGTGDPCNCSCLVHIPTFRALHWPLDRPRKNIRSEATRLN